jgi:hypothetical protein
MMYEPVAHIFTPADEEAPLRAARLRELGLGEHPEPEFDDFARMLATSTKSPLAVVNFIGEHQQYFAGMHGPEMLGTTAVPDDSDRSMFKDKGWCPHVVSRKLPLVLDDVCDYPRFAGNPIVDEFGIRSYVGAPLIDKSGTALGTICIVDMEPRPWGRPGLEFIKAKAAEMMEIINKRG